VPVKRRLPFLPFPIQPWDPVVFFFLARRHSARTQCLHYLYARTDFPVCTSKSTVWGASQNPLTSAATPPEGRVAAAVGTVHCRYQRRGTSNDRLYYGDRWSPARGIDGGQWIIIVALDAIEYVYCASPENLIDSRIGVDFFRKRID
jgi:hypothetical protein